MTRKVYHGEFAMPHEIEVAAHNFYEAIRKSGYDSANIDVCPGLNSCHVRLTKFNKVGEDIDPTQTELADGKWQVVGWVDDDDD